MFGRNGFLPAGTLLTVNVILMVHKNSDSDVTTDGFHDMLKTTTEPACQCILAVCEAKDTDVISND